MVIFLQKAFADARTGGLTLDVTTTSTVSIGTEGQLQLLMFVQSELKAPVQIPRVLTVIFIVRGVLMPQLLEAVTVNIPLVAVGVKPILIVLLVLGGIIAPVLE